MKSKLTVWAFLRLLLLAVAVAASWIALSAAGASADSSPPGGPLLVPSQAAVASVTTVTHRATDVLAPAESGPVSAPATPPPVALPPLRPVVEDVSASADDALQAVPVVSTVVPAGAVATVVDPAVGTVDGVMGETVGTVVPVTPGLTTAAPPLPAGVDVPSAGDGVPAQPAELAAGTTGAAPAAVQSLHEIPAPRQSFYSHGPACDPRIRPAAGTPLLLGADPQSRPFHGQADPTPIVPGATGASSASGGGVTAVPAWLSVHDLQVPAARTAAIQGGSSTAPAPVSFDPGSSPD